MKVKEIIVVEGKSDTIKVKQAVQADTIETNGSAINKETLQLIKHAKRKRGVIIFTDPDFPGERIRHIINQEVPGCKHAFLSSSEAKSSSIKKSIGIEHASVQAIKQALHHVHELTEGIESDITQRDLLTYGLIGGLDAKIKREQLGSILHIGYTNGKQLLNRLHMFQISKNELDLAMKHIL
ncbi:ribonuclease M5 [Pseudogracilibacillus auburnensis]|uniref:ribonuclease M5 n=1 Tax=Pseudogracilibacillus auburnensis TaxID=1494959 RepID=UPI001A976495|nr:ribonuclease M5 [Pseudogracilibacillus auburnensis]MBO1004465.1 ribonuclease M5 [Pseudogracilibacillus auburnensis]